MENHVLSDTVRRDLVVEQARLVAERDRINAALAHIEGLLNGRGAGKPTLRATLTLREAILAILKEHPRGLRPIEVTERLQADGYQSSGNTKLSLLVSGTMFRLDQNGVLNRLQKSGAYRLREFVKPEGEGSTL